MICDDNAHDDYSLVEPFDIDDGALDGLGPEQAFVLGVEWASFRAQMLTQQPFEMQVHRANARRLWALGRRNGREVVINPRGSEWVVLSVEGF